MSEIVYYKDYWNSPTFSFMGDEQGYIIMKDVITVDETLKKLSTFEPFEIALEITKKFYDSKMDIVNPFSQPLLLCKTRYDHYKDRMLYFVLPADSPFPYQYIWENRQLKFDFTGIVFERSDIENINFIVTECDFDLKIPTNAPKPYPNPAFLLEHFPEEGPQARTEAILAEIAASKSIPVKQKDKNKMGKANEKRLANTEARWKEQFALGIKAALYCMEQHQQTGKPITRKEYETMLTHRCNGSFMVEAGRIFREIMPPEILHRGD